MAGHRVLLSLRACPWAELVLGKKKKDARHARLAAVAKYWFCLVSPSLGTWLSGCKRHPPLSTVSPGVYSGHWAGFRERWASAERGRCRQNGQV